MPHISLFRRCDKLLFMSTVEDDTIGSIAIPNITNGRDSFWNKTKKVRNSQYCNLIILHICRLLFTCGIIIGKKQTGL